MNTITCIAIRNALNTDFSKKVVLMFLGSLFSGLLLYKFPENGFDPVEGRLADAFHLPMGFFLSLVLMWTFDCDLLLSKLAIYVFLSCAIFSGIGEIVQPYFGRGKSIYDWIYGLMGFASGISCYVLLIQKIKIRIIWFCWLTISIIMQVFALIPFWDLYLKALERYNMFPKLADFSFEHASNELSFWKPIRGQGKVIGPSIENYDLGKYMSISGNGRGFFGMEMAVPKKTWLGFETLNIILVGSTIGAESYQDSAFLSCRSPGFIAKLGNFENRQQIVVRIDDCHGDGSYGSRYNAQFEIGNGSSKISIPFSRLTDLNGKMLDLSCIVSVVVFANANGANFSFGVGDMWLE